MVGGDGNDNGIGELGKLDGNDGEDCELGAAIAIVTKGTFHTG